MLNAGLSSGRSLVITAMLSAFGSVTCMAMDEAFLLPADDSVVGSVDQVQSMYEDTLPDIARRYGLGYEEIIRANPAVDPWLPGHDTEVRLPTQFVLPQAARRGLVINIAEYRMYYFSRQGDQNLVATFPISIGRMDWGTPLGRSSIVKKVRSPSWYPPASIREEYAAEGRVLESVIPPGPDNPLGDYAMRLSIPGYLLHGTNRPAGVGMRVTHGCIRMYPEDIEWLYPQIPVETMVQIVNQPYKLGWFGNDLYLEVHPPLDEDEPGRSRSMTAITELYVRVTRERAAEVNWNLIDEVYRDQRGIPVKIGHAIAETGDAMDSLSRSPAAPRTVADANHSGGGEAR